MILALLAMLQPEIVVAVPRTKPTRAIECENPLAEWQPMTRRSRSVPMGRGRFSVHHQVSGGFFLYTCTSDQKSAFGLLSRAQRSAIEDRLRAIEKARIADRHRELAERHRALIQRDIAALN